MLEHRHVFKGRGPKSCVCGISVDTECKNRHSRDNSYRNNRNVWVCRTCQNDRVANWRATQMTPEQHATMKARGRKIQSDLYARRRKAVFDFYGWSCDCCLEDTNQFLCIDHIGGGGNKHRRELTGRTDNGGGSTMKLYKWLIDNHFPGGFRTLCHNCNHATRMGDPCPHELEKR